MNQQRTDGKSNSITSLYLFNVIVYTAVCKRIYACLRCSLSRGWIYSIFYTKQIPAGFISPWRLPVNQCRIHFQLKNSQHELAYNIFPILFCNVCGMFITWSLTEWATNGWSREWVDAGNCRLSVVFTCCSEGSN